MNPSPTFHLPVPNIGRRHFLATTIAGLGAAGSTRAAGANETKPALGTIVITTPTGTIGSRILEQVLESGARIRIIARDPSKIPARIRGRVEVVQGSHGDAEVVERAFDGVHTVFWICPPDPGAASVEAAYVGFTRPACEALKNQGVKRVVSISALGRGTTMAANAGFVTASLAMDDLIMSTGVSFRALTMPSFMDNLLRQTDSIADNSYFYSPIDGDRKLPACAVRDIVAVAAKLLLDPSWSDQASVPVLGPEDISHNEMARIMSEVLGKPVVYRLAPFEKYQAFFIEHGMSGAMAQGMTDMMRAKNTGLDNGEPRTPENTTPTTFRQWCETELKPAILKRAAGNQTPLRD